MSAFFSPPPESFGKFFFESARRLCDIRRKPMKVPFNRISLEGSEIRNIEEAIAVGHLQGDGKFMKICEEKISAMAGAKAALLTNSCTASLDMAAMLCDISAGDEVIVPSYTFVSSANAFVLRGAKPVFCDISPDTLNIDASKIEELVTPRTRAIVPVHYAGVGCEMDEILAVAKRHSVKVVEDAAQGFMASYKGRALGSIGDFGSISFHGTKNVVCGEGGALLVNDPKFRDRACFIREKGTNRIHFVEGKIDKYTWVDCGDSFIPSEILAAFLAAQLDAAERLTSGRVAAWNYYYSRLSELERSGDLQLAKIPEHCRHNAHIFFILTDSPETEKELEKFMKSREIGVAQHYAPLHLCPMARRLGCASRPLPVSERLSKTMLRLPIFSSISRAEQDFVCDCLGEFFRGKQARRALA